MKIKTIIFFTLLVLFCISSFSFVFADNITFSLDQKDYYFVTGEDAIFILHTNNSFEKTIDGTLSYTVSQSLNQGGMQYSNTNTQSTPFSVEKNESDIQMSFGSSDVPLILSVDLTFSYEELGTNALFINDITIYFVENESEKNNEENSQSSSSEKEDSSSQESEQAPAEDQKNLQDSIKEMFENKEQPEPLSETEEKLQNNQLSQDTSALKNEMNNKLREQQEMEDAFQNELVNNENFQKEQQELLDAGYNISDANLNPTSNNSGDFNIDYKNALGKNASLSGDMVNGSIDNIQKSSQEENEKSMDLLNDNEDYQRFVQELENASFEKTDTVFSQVVNETEIIVNYLNKNNESASITATIENDIVKNVEKNVDKNKSFWTFFLWISFVFLVFIVLSFFLYKRFMSIKKPVQPVIKKVLEEPFDYHDESILLLEKSKVSFSMKKYKDAYSLIAQALRLVYSYENNLNKELTNDDLITFLRREGREYLAVKNCFDLCSLVEFAKYSANKNDFNKILIFAEPIILKNNSLKNSKFLSVIKK